MKTIFFTLFFLVASYVFANPVDVKTASLVAENYCNSNAKVKANALSLTYQEITSTGDTAIFYVFNINKSDGWIIIAATDASYPVLGYSPSGNYSKQDQPPALIYWMEGYKNQILDILRRRIPPTTEIIAEWATYKSLKGGSSNKSPLTVGPLLSTTWNQGQYYNAWCPGGCPTGCVATAMAQIMKYWASPAVGSGDHCYQHPAYGQLCANFGNTTYNWNAMPNNVTSSNTAVATLMYHCGVSVNMDYCQNGTNQSGAYVLTNDPSGYHPFSAQSAYSTYFGYNSSTIQGKLRASYSESFWINSIIKPELDASIPRPIQYVGWDVNGQGGHTWVCDGYNSNNLFHMNWGWGGMNDGWFNLNTLNPGIYYFDNGQQALVGIQPIGGGQLTNDDCGNSATMLTSSTTCNYSPGTVAGATSSGIPIPNCSGYQSQTALDVWFQFVAVCSEHTISVDPEGNTTGNNNYLDVVVGLYSICSGSGFIECFDQSGSGGVTTTYTFSGLTPGETYYIRVFDYGNSQPIYPGFNICVTHSCGGSGNVNLVFSQYEIDDDASGGSNGDDDGQCEPGEDIELDVELYNSGTQDANNVEGLLSTSDPDITITDNQQSWGTIAAGEYDWTSDFDFTVSTDCPEKDVTFILNITSDEGSWTESFTLHIYGMGGSGSVALEFSQFEVDDDASGGSNGDADGQCEPGEDIELIVELFNSGTEDANNVEGTLSTNDSDITITDNQQSWGTIVAGGYDTTTDFDFSVSADCPEKDVTFTLDITSDEGSWTDSFTLHIYGMGGSGSVALEFSQFEVDDDASGGSNGDADGQCEPGEDIELNVELYNSGTEDANNVVGTLSTTDSDITITDNQQSWGTIAAGQYSWTSDFDFTVSAECTEKDVTFILNITSDEGSWVEQFIVHIYSDGTSDCLTCPQYDYDLSPDNNWQIHNSTINPGSCKIYRITTVSGGNYTFKTGCEDGATASFDSFFELMDDNCTLMVENDDECEEMRTKTEWTSYLPDNTVVYLKVRGFSTSDYGSYALAYKLDTSPEADFSGSPGSGSVPLTVSFIDLSTNSPNSWSWDFGDGYTSSSQNPNHNYTTPGSYTVSLTVTNQFGSDTETKTSYINATSSGYAPVANFNGSPRSGNSPLAVSFNDLSTNNPSSWSWNFGDGSTSSSQNPSHIYYTPGSYTVSLTVTNQFGSDTETKSGYITVTAVGSTPIANFSGSPTSGSVPLTVSFSDLSSNSPSSWSWNFGDGSTSSSQNPSHIYNTPGLYTVSLTVTNQFGSDTETKSSYITATLAGSTPIANFSGSPTSGNAPLTVSFSDLSSNSPSSWSWNFGDGYTSSSQNPTHTYLTSGEYNVILTVTNQYGEDIESKSEYITVDCLVPDVQFAASQSSGSCPLSIDYFDLTPTTGITSWLWTFYNGESSPIISTEKNPVGIVYNKQGSFLTSLRVTDECGTHTRIIPDMISVSCTIGIEETAGSDFGINIYPNPTSAYVTILPLNAKEKSFQLTLMNPLGVVLRRAEYVHSESQDRIIMDLTDLPKGHYVLTIYILEDDIQNSYTVIKQ